jgi:phosphoribosyl 1,2-cyclic phosphodiesterase
MKIQNFDIRLRFWGVRGSIPVPGKDYSKYGGNTSCVEVKCGQTLIVLDAGTGIRNLGHHYLREYGASPIHFNILISHTHWDHIQGFPFLPHIYMPGNHISFYGGHTVSTLEKLIMTQLSGEFHPKTLYELEAEVDFEQLKKNKFKINNVHITTTHLLHPGLSLGFRIEYKKFVIAYVTDNEIIEDKRLARHNWENIGNLVNNADIVIHDAQYTDEEYRFKIGWGHSSLDNVIRLCDHYNVKKLYAFHHDPNHTDKLIEKMVRKGRKLVKSKMKVFAAKEGDEITLNR